MLVKLSRSSFIEWSPDYGCIIQERCYARFDPRDEVGNLLRQPDLIKEGEYNFLLKGPIASELISSKVNLFYVLE